MTPARILELALLCEEEPDAIFVLGDACLEQEWFCPRAVKVSCTAQNGAAVHIPPKLAEHAARSWPSRPTKQWARAVLAVALFESWPTRRFPIRRMSVEDMLNQGPSFSETLATLRRRYRG